MSESKRAAVDADRLPVPAARGSGKTSTLDHTNKVVKALPKRSMEKALALQDECLKLALPLFYRQRDPVHSLGFTSAVAGEGKTLLSVLTSGALANNTGRPVTLIECHWDHPSLHHYFGIPANPGLADWLRLTHNHAEVITRVHDHLSVIPAGNGQRDAITLMQTLWERGLTQLTDGEDDRIVIVDLPPVVNSAGGLLAAHIPDALMVVVCAGITPRSLVAKANQAMAGLPVEGVVLNQTHSRLPRWLQNIL
ncbi:MAG TPA: hypothetical protein VF792_05410 [Ktedonobacterales bacterium]